MNIGFTSTIPVEILLAAHVKPVDLNNIFITHAHPESYIRIAERRGFPRNFCCWIKGLYGVIKHHHIKTVIGVVGGDCSNTRVLMDVLAQEGVRVIPFSYPYARERKQMKLSLEGLMRALHVTYDDVYAAHTALAPIRQMVYDLDQRATHGSVPSSDLHQWQVSCSDFWGDPQRFAKALHTYLKKIAQKKNNEPHIRLGYIGVPPIATDLYTYLDSLGTRVVFNEVQRQFTFPFLDGKKVTRRTFADLFIEQYCAYTYPYSITARLDDIQQQITQRTIQGIIHYVQSFCYKQVDDIIVRDMLRVPVLTLEEDRPGKLSARSKIRLEAFVAMVRSHNVSWY